MLHPLRPSASEILLRVHTAHATGVYPFLWTSPRDRAASQDLLQEVFVKLARDMSGLTVAVSEQAWTFRISRNVALDRLRRRKVRVEAAVHPESFKVGSFVHARFPFTSAALMPSPRFRENLLEIILNSR